MVDDGLLFKTVSKQGSISAVRLETPEHVLVDLRARLRNTRWPEAETVGDWSQGVPLRQAQALWQYWIESYDWRHREGWFNGLPQFRTEVDGLPLYFIEVRSPEADALPLLMTHGWPGSVLEFHKVLGPLTDPVRHGGRAQDAFHVVLPALPGFGFSGKPARGGWGISAIAAAWHELMRRLGHRRYVAQGGDWGAAVTTRLAKLAPSGLLAVHMNVAIAIPDPLPAEPDDEERSVIGAMSEFERWETGYSQQQSTRPQTLGYGLADSPVGQAMWIYEKYRAWSDCDGEVESVISRDELLDTVMLYWLTNSGASSARLYWESYRDGLRSPVIETPVGISLFPKEMLRVPRRWAERHYKNLIHWNCPDKGGHFAALEQPDIFVDELRTCFRQVR